MLYRTIIPKVDKQAKRIKEESGARVIAMFYPIQPSSSTKKIKLIMKYTEVVRGTDTADYSRVEDVIFLTPG